MATYHKRQPPNAQDTADRNRYTCNDRRIKELAPPTLSLTDCQLRKMKRAEKARVPAAPPQPRWWYLDGSMTIELNSVAHGHWGCMAS